MDNFESDLKAATRKPFFRRIDWASFWTATAISFVVYFLTLGPTVSLEELCLSADIISLHVPLNDSTRGLIGAHQIELMKDGVMLINAARGAVTDEKAVAMAVESGKIGAFGSDVYSQEPFPEDHPFYGIKEKPNVLLTPHMAWGAVETRLRF